MATTGPSLWFLTVSLWIWIPLMMMKMMKVTSNGDMEILLLFKKKITEDPMFALENWNSKVPNAPCSWRGVTCDAEKNVKLLVLADLSLKGSIDPIITNLYSLKHLNLSGNKLTGNTPVFMNNNFLEVIDLSRNNLAGYLSPFCYSSVQSVREAYFRDNRLIGDLHMSLLGCGGLRILDVRNNKFTGQVLEFLVLKVLTLRSLYLSNNKLEGMMPSLISKMTELETIDIGSNKFSGTLPSSIGNLRFLLSLNADGNMFSGSIPNEIGDCKRLQVLQLASNSLSGVIPKTISSMSYLKQLDLSNNRLTGDIPPTLSNIPGIQKIMLADNDLGGTIPPSLGYCQALEYLNLSKNREIGGSIPSKFGRLLGLQVLDLSGASLSGNIPEEIGNLLSLSILNLSRNSLSGSIPNSIKNLMHLEYFDISQNQLVGLVPSSTNLQRFPLSSFQNNSGLCGWIYEQADSECLESGFRLKKKALIFGGSGVGLLAGILIWILYSKRASFGIDIPVEQPLLLEYSSESLFVSTQNLSEENRICTGTHYTFFYGKLDTNQMVVVKCMQEEFWEALGPIFVEDCNSIAAVKHNNIASVLGVCFSAEMQALVLECPAIASLEQSLYGMAPSLCLNWEMRSRVIMGIANGLSYLHEYWQNDPIIRCELRANSVVFDESIRAQIIDYSIWKPDMSLNHNAIYMTGYKAPEYALGVADTTNSEVYSYGVLLLEIITGKPPSSFCEQGKTIAEWVAQSYPDQVWEIIDLVVQETIEDSMQVLNLIELALNCTALEPDSRPIMAIVKETLNNIFGFLGYEVENEAPNIFGTTMGEADNYAIKEQGNSEMGYEENYAIREEGNVEMGYEENYAIG